MSIGTIQIDMHGLQGTLISLFLIGLAKIFMLIDVTGFLQGTAYLFTILVAVDTLTGSRIKTFFTPKKKPNKKV
jgi:hypothetical protein